MKKIFLVLLGLGNGQTLNSFSATINLANPCEGAENCELNLEAITAIACEGLFDCTGTFSWPEGEKPDDISDGPIENPLEVVDEVKDKCKFSREIIAIPGQFESDPYNQLPDHWPNDEEQLILEPIMQAMKALEELNGGTFPCQTILNFATFCPGESRPDQLVCNQLREAIHKVFDFLPTREFPTCLESFECVPDFFADICPQHIDCDEGMEENIENNECLPTVAWPRALLIDLDTLDHNYIPKIEKGELTIDTTGFYTRGSMYSFYGNKHYFFGGEDLRFDDNRVFEENVVYLDDHGFKRTEIFLPKHDGNMIYKGFARGAAAIFQGKVWICGVGFAPDSCYHFSGKNFSVKLS